MLVAQEVDEGDADENVEKVNVGDTAEGDVSAAHGDVPTVDDEPSILSPTPPTPPPQPSHDIPSTSHVQPTPPQLPQVQQQSPQPQPQSQQDAIIPINLLQEVMDTCKALSRRVKYLELDKIAQALEITKLKKRVKKLERRNKVKVLKLRRLQKGRMIVEMDQDVDVVLEDDKEIANEVVDNVQNDIDESAQDQRRKEDESKLAEVQEVVDVFTTAKIITEVVTAAASETITAASTQVLAAILTVAPARVTATPSRIRKGVVIRYPQEESTTSIIISAETKSKDKVIDHVKRKAKEDPAVKKYQALKRKPRTEAQARNNMKLYLKNVAGFKMDYFNGMSYDDIQEESRAQKRINETLAERAAKRKKLDEEVEELKRHLQIVSNEDDDVYTEATPLAQKIEEMAKYLMLLE
nr:hypothetical protein [Tanacetum cinerariifolium]